MQFLPDVVIVANGTFPQSSVILDMIISAPHTIVCDGALEMYMNAMGRIPELVVGDGDSVQKYLLQRFDINFIKIDEQETNDLTKCVKMAISKGWNKILIVAATGMRDDHMIGNIFLLPSYFRMGAYAIMMTDYGYFSAFQGKLELSLPVGKKLSFFPVENKPLTAKGVLYPFENRIFNEMWEATLNEVSEETVTLFSEGVTILYIANETRV